jgi:rhodanese-related sulfurtransferase
MAMRAPWWLPFGRVPALSPRELLEALSGGSAPQLLDVRSGPEFAAGHIAGAAHVPITALPARLPGLGLDPRRPVVAICLSAHRSPPAVRLLRGSGFEAFQLAGGMLAWRAAGLPEDGR